MENAIFRATVDQLKEMIDLDQTSQSVNNPSLKILINKVISFYCEDILKRNQEVNHD